MSYFTAQNLSTWLINEINAYRIARKEYNAFRIMVPPICLAVLLYCTWDKLALFSLCHLHHSHPCINSWDQIDPVNNIFSQASSRMETMFRPSGFFPPIFSCLHTVFFFDSCLYILLLLSLKFMYQIIAISKGVILFLRHVIVCNDIS